MYGCTYNAKWKNGCSLFFLSLLFVIILISWCVVGGVKASSDATLSISVSLVEGDTFGPGDSFHSITEIRNSAASGRVDVVLTYAIMDENGQSILVESTTVAIETLSSFSEELTLPENIDEGVYVLKASVASLDRIKQSEASRSFTVAKVSESEQRLIEYVMAGALVLTGGGLIYEHRRISKLKVSGKDLKRFIEGQHKK